MTILNINNYHFIRGGSDKIFFNHMEILNSKGIKSIPFSPLDDNSIKSPWNVNFPKAVDVKNPKPLDLPKFFYNIEAKSMLSELLTTNNISLAHLHIYYGRLTTSILDSLKSKSIPIIQTLHDYKLICPNNNLIDAEKICEFCDGNKFYKSIYKKCNDGSLLKTSIVALESYFSKWNGNISKIDHFIAVSHFLKTKLTQYGIPEDKITVIHNPIDHKLYEPSYDNNNYFIYFGRIEKIKGINSMIKASIEADVNLKIVGDGNELDSLKEEFKEHTKIEFLGFKSGKNLEKLIKESIASICPSICYDIFPTSILESFAYGKAVIGSNIGGIPEMIDHDINGYLYTPGNHKQLSSLLKQFQLNKVNHKKFGENARLKVVENYNKEQYFLQIKKLYEKYI